MTTSPAQLAAAVTAHEVPPYTTLPLSQIDRDPHQPRKHFDPGEIEELAGSIRAHGLLHPLHVRPLAGGKRFGLVAGERRFRGAGLAGLDTVPVLVEELDDAAVREVQLEENVHRKDLRPLEEAEHFARMIRLDGKTAETIAEKISKSPSYVRLKIALTTLHPDAKEALDDGRLSESHCVEVARIPMVFHAEAVRDLLGEGDFTDYAAVRVGELDGDVAAGEPRNIPVPLSLRQARTHLAAKYHLRLEVAGFDITDAALVEKAGACGPCPSNTSNQDGALRPGLCTNRACFGSKRAAQYDRAAADATRNGLIVLDQAEGVFDSYDPTRVAYGSKYVDPKDPLPPEHAGKRGCETWGDLLGDASAQRYLVKDGGGRARELVDRTAALEAARVAGRLKKEGPSGQAAASTAEERGDDYKKTERARAERIRHKRAVDQRALAAIVGKAEDGGFDKPVVLRAIATGLVWMAPDRVTEAVASRRELGKGGKLSGRTALLGRIEKAASDECRGLIAELVGARVPVSGEPEPIEAMAEAFKIDLKSIDATVRAEAKAASREKGKGKRTAPNLAAKRGAK